MRGHQLNGLRDVANDAATLGPRAIEDQVRAAATGYGIKVEDCAVTTQADYGTEVEDCAVTTQADKGEALADITSRCYVVKLTYRERSAPQTALKTAFFVRKPEPAPQTLSWTAALSFMRERSWATAVSFTPPHAAGELVNVAEADYEHILERIRQATGYSGLAWGDLWMHQCSGHLHVGCVTRAGEIAFTKWTEVEKFVSQGYAAQTDTMYHFSDPKFT